MKEEFVTYEIAKKLKKKGFREKCLCHYNNNDILKENYDKCWCSANDIFTDNCVDAPTISHVLKWLGDAKKIYVVVTPYPSMSTKDKVIWSYQIKYKSDGAFMEKVDGLESYMDNRDASLAGIEYVIDNLI